MPESDSAPQPWEEWVERVRSGDQSAARQLVHALLPTVTAIVRGRLPRSVSAEDLAQEVFMKVFTRLDQYRSEMPFDHWVARIASNTCIDALRKQGSRPELRRADLSNAECQAWDSLLVDEVSDSPAEALAARDLLAQLLDSLPAQERLLIEWIDLEQRTMDDVAELTGWSKMILKVRVFRARSKLRAALEKLERKDIR